MLKNMLNRVPRQKEVRDQGVVRLQSLKNSWINRLYNQGPKVTERKDNYYRAGCKDRLFSPSSLKHKERAMC